MLGPCSAVRVLQTRYHMEGLLVHGYSSGFEDRQKRITVTAASEARIWRENTRVGMQDRVRGLEEVKCQIGIQKHRENGHDRLTFITP